MSFLFFKWKITQVVPLFSGSYFRVDNIFLVDCFLCWLDGSTIFPQFLSGRKKKGDFLKLLLLPLLLPTTTNTITITTSTITRVTKYQIYQITKRKQSKNKLSPYFLYFLCVNGNSVLFFLLRTCVGRLKVQLVVDVTGRHEPKEETTERKVFCAGRKSRSRARQSRETLLYSETRGLV